MAHDRVPADESRGGTGGEPVLPTSARDFLAASGPSWMRRLQSHMAWVGVSETQVSESDSRARQWRCFSETLSEVQESGSPLSVFGARGKHAKVRCLSEGACQCVCVCVSVCVCGCVGMWVSLGVFEFVCVCARASEVGIQVWQGERERKTRANLPLCNFGEEPCTMCVCVCRC